MASTAHEALVGRKVLLDIHTSTSGCIRVIGVIISGTAREESREESGQRTLEHRETSTDYCSVGLDGRPNSRVECTIYLIFVSGSGIEGSHPQD